MYPNELKPWRQRQKELLQEAGNRHLARQFRTARRKRKQVELFSRLLDRHSWPKPPGQLNASKLDLEKCPETQK